MVIILADDLTGAGDTGAQYKKNNFSTFVGVNCKDGKTIKNILAKDYEVISVNTDSRPLEKTDAYNRLFDITLQIKDMPNDYVYKKIDSIMRGNPATELLAVMDAMEAEIAIVAPSFPENGRVIENGLLGMPNGTKLDVVKLFGEKTGKKTVNISLETLRRGEESVIEQITKLRAEGAEIFILDAACDKDLETIKNVANKISFKKILCGSAGFAKFLSERKNEGVILFVVASRSIETAKQLKEVERVYNAPIIKVSSAEIRDGDKQKAIDDAVEKVMEFSDADIIAVAIDSLFDGADVVLQSSADENMKSLEIASSMGEIVKELRKRIKIKTVVTTGGDTSFQTCARLNSDGIELEDEIVSGVPIGKLVGGDAEGLDIVTKSGGFGDSDAFIKVIEYINR